MRKILFLSDDFPPQSFGGAGISTYELAKGVQKAGHEVFVVTTVRNKSEAGEDVFDGLKIFKITSNYSEKWRAYVSLYNPQVVRKLEKILKSVRPDVVHANNIHHHLSYASIKLSKKYARVVITLRDAMSFSFGKLQTKKYLENFDAHVAWSDQLRQAKKRWNPFRNFIIKKYLGYADKIFAVSHALKRALEQNGIKNVEVLHTGIDMGEYQAFRKEGDKQIIFFAGRLNEAKGARVVEQAMQIISKEVPNAKLITAGTNGKWLDRGEMKLAYNNASVVLVPSVCFDALPRAVLEAMAMARPVVATHYGGAREAVLDGVTGYIVNPFDIKTMSEKVIELLKNPEKAKQFGEAGRSRIEELFNLDDKISALTTVYERLS